MNAIIRSRLATALDLLGIKYVVSIEGFSLDGMIAVDRTSMVCAVPFSGNEGASYDAVKSLLQMEIAQGRLIWNGKCDTYLYLDLIGA